jgi:hypothetical protein
MNMENPFAAPIASAMEAHLARVEAFYAQLAAAESKAMEQSKTALDESARLSRETLAYSTTLATEWRRASLEATRTAMKMMFPFAG